MSRMNREIHVRFCEGVGVKFLRATRGSAIMGTSEETAGWFVLGQFAHSAYFLKWAKSHYGSFRRIHDKQSSQLHQEAFEQISLAVILSVMALEAFLNEMAFLELNNPETKLNDQEKEVIRGQIESGHLGYWPIEDKICKFTKILVKQKFPKGGGGSFWEKLTRLVKYRKDLVHFSPDGPTEIVLSPGFAMKSGVPTEADIAISCTRVLFQQIADYCDFDPSDVAKEIITAIENAGYRLPDSLKHALARI